MISDQLIERFLQGQCSREEAEQVQRYFDEHPDDMERLMNQTDWHNTPAEEPLPGGLSDRMLHEIKLQAYGEVRPVSMERRPLAKITRMIAAAAALITVAAGIWLLTRNSGHQIQPAVTMSQPVNSSPKQQQQPQQQRQQWTTRDNPAGRESRIELPDHSTVLLTAHSTLRYPEPFSRDKREIQLDGEAFFNVVKDNSRPFIVYTGNLSTTVLGTSFRITAFHNGRQQISIRLFTGKVLVSASGEKPQSSSSEKPQNVSKVLSAGDQLQYETADGRMVLSRWQPADRRPDEAKTPGISGPQGDLVFDNTPFDGVMTALQKKYGVTITYNRAQTADIYFSGTVGATDSLPMVLNMIARVNGLEVTSGRNGYTIRRR